MADLRSAFAEQTSVDESDSCAERVQYVEAERRTGYVVHQLACAALVVTGFPQLWRRTSKIGARPANATQSRQRGTEMITAVGSRGQLSFTYSVPRHLFVAAH
jgi:hypothetical protein